jgi:hypothetical protein
MTFTVQGSEPLDAALRLRLTSQEKGSLESEAYSYGLSMSELVRRRYFGRPIITSADMAMVKELRRIGGLLKHVHVDSEGAYSIQTAETLTVLRRYIEKISDRQEN